MKRKTLGMLLGAVLCFGAGGAFAAEKPGTRLDDCLKGVVASDASAEAGDADALAAMLPTVADCLDFENQHCSLRFGGRAVNCISRERRRYRTVMGGAMQAVTDLGAPYTDALELVNAELAEQAEACNATEPEAGHTVAYVRAKCDFEIVATRYGFMRFSMLREAGS